MLQEVLQSTVAHVSQTEAISEVRLVSWTLLVDWFPGPCWSSIVADILVSIWPESCVHGCGQQDANNKMIINRNTKQKQKIKTRNKEFRMASSKSSQHGRVSDVRPLDNRMPTKEKIIIINRNTKNKIVNTTNKK